MSTVPLLTPTDSATILSVKKEETGGGGEGGTDTGHTFYMLE